MIPFAVLRQYPRPLGDAVWSPCLGGFSGARVFASATHILKSWPAGTVAERVRKIHQSRQHVAGLPFIAPLVNAVDAQSFAESDGLIWEVHERLPGAPVDSLSVTQLESAGSAIAAMHSRWPKSPAITHPIRDRIEYVNQKLPLLRSLQFGTDSELQSLHREAIERLSPLVIPNHTLATQTIHGDLHSGHVFFQRDGVSGVIDFASIRYDHPALDLARYYGEFGNPAAGVEAYRAAGGSRAVTTDLVCGLVRVIAAGTVLHWLPRLAVGEFATDQRAAIVRRIGGALDRLS